ncbi:hypothetical protein [Pseudoalteromonas xiamenensis]
MIDISVLPLFLVSVFKSGLAILLGIFGAGLPQTGLVAFGLGDIMQTMSKVALAVKVIGACYLLWLGGISFALGINIHKVLSMPKLTN